MKKSIAALVSLHMEADNPGGRLPKVARHTPLEITADPKIAKAAEAVLKEVTELFNEYDEEVWRSENLAPFSKIMYREMAKNFVLWMHGKFKPGAAGLKPRTRRRPFR